MLFRSLHGACACEKTTISRDYGAYVKARIGDKDWEQDQDPLAMAPYLVHGGSAASFITYDDPASTARKVAYALEVRNLGGVFMWELSEDFDGKKQDLLDSMYRAYRRAEGSGR